jgi:diguanylate cyclase (GGDEF)-like protein
MPENNLKSVLENIISLTSERDTNAIELALAQTLFKLAAPESMTLYRASSIDNIKYTNTLIGKQQENEDIPADILDALKECLETCKTTYAQRHGKKITLFPLLNAKNQPIAVIMIEAMQDSQDHSLTLMILKIYHNFVALMNENERDTLTGLLNRKTFDLKINNIISGNQNVNSNLDSEDILNRRANKSNHSYLAIFDIDHFKRVNDTFGHLMGDEVLLLFSRVLEKSFRDQDLLFRFGGEEFIGIFHCQSDQIMYAVLNRFRENIEMHSFPQVGKVTVSAGFTKIDAYDTSSNIIGRADAALYHAKKNGRNQVRQHEQLISSGDLQHSKNSGEIELF